MLRMKPTVLVVEDEPDVLDLVSHHMRRAGLEVYRALTGDEGLLMARRHFPNVILLDLMLPGLDGLEVCRQLKADPATASIPVLMLTAKAGTKNRVKGLEIGADDYVPKPFSPRELVLRVQALLRRTKQQGPSQTMLRAGNIELDKSRFEALLDGEKLQLTLTEFKLLSALMEKRGRILSRETLLTEVWGYQKNIDTRTVDTHMRRLREKLGTHAASIETVRGEGYRFIELGSPSESGK
jgi:two-component system phosphate regulon response regulator PhoB